MGIATEVTTEVTLNVRYFQTINNLSALRGKGKMKEKGELQMKLPQKITFEFTSEFTSKLTNNLQECFSIFPLQEAKANWRTKRRIATKVTSEITSEVTWSYPEFTKRFGHFLCSGWSQVTSHTKKKCSVTWALQLLLNKLFLAR